MEINKKGRKREIKNPFAPRIVSLGWMDFLL